MIKVLESLEITNGQMMPKFDPYTDIYSVVVDEAVNSLVINYKVKEGYKVDVEQNQNLKAGENEVFIRIKNDKGEEQIVTLLVNKERVKSTILEDSFMEPVEIVKPLPGYIAPLMGIICFLIILTTFLALFHKRKR